VLRWPVPGPPGYWLLASNTATKVCKTAIHTVKQYTLGNKNIQKIIAQYTKHQLQLAAMLHRKSDRRGRKLLNSVTEASDTHARSASDHLRSLTPTPRVQQNSGVQERGVQTPPKFRGPSKIVPNSTRLLKLLKIAEFRTPTPQDVRKKKKGIKF